MVLRRRERHCGGAVAQRKKRSFFALQEFLDHHLRAGSTEPALEHHVDRGFRLFDRFRDHNALAGGEAVGLHHDRRAVLSHVILRRSCRREALIGRGRDVVRAADILGESLRAFKLRGHLRGTERLDPGGFQIVDDAGAKRRFRSHHDEADALVLAEGDHRRMIGRIERHAFGLLRDPGIARRAIEAVHQRARRHFPGQRMLASAGSEQKDVHSMNPSCPGLTRAPIKNRSMVSR